MAHHKLTKTERELIDRWKEEGVSNKQIARRLNRSPATIGRELSRNSIRFGEYEAAYAQRLSAAKKEKAWGAKHPLKNETVYRYVIAHLREGWSPEQIAGRLRVTHPDNTSFHISPETIYGYIYGKANRKERLWEYLRRKQARRRKKWGRKAQRVRIPDRVSIHERPAVIDQRIELGHWEGDSLVGKGRKNGLHTAYERVASFTRLQRMNHMTARASITAQERIYRDLPPHARRSVTLDNGAEHAAHRKLKEKLGMETYFADPYCACQRGGNENANLWIRYFFPKGTDFAAVSDEEIAAVEYELNTRPRKRLGFKTPLEVFREKLLRGCDRS